VLQYGGMVDKNLIEALLKHTVDNEIEILQSKTCTCLFCRHQIDARSVSDWVDTEGGVSALCPECGMASLVGDASGYLFDRDLLREINQKIYGDDYMEEHPEAVETYIKRYRSNAITHKPNNEKLYINYLTMVANRGNVDALYALGEFYRFGSEYSLPNLDMAFSIYDSPTLKNDGLALAFLGRILSDKRYSHHNEEEAYRSFSKAQALGSELGAMYFADCYALGIAVKQDSAFAKLVYEGLFGRNDVIFRFTGGEETFGYGLLCYRLGMMAYKGEGQEKNDRQALRFFLLGRYALTKLKEKQQTDPEDEEILKKMEELITEIAANYSLMAGSPVFDRDTFDDTMCVTSYSADYNLFPATLENIHFNEDEGILEFDVVSKNPLLALDTGKLYAGFIPERIHWYFEDVEAIRTGRGKNFNRIVGSPNEGYRFFANPNYNNAIFEIRFAKDSSKDDATFIDGMEVHEA